MAAGILLIIVVAVTSAITSGQQHAYEAHQNIAAALAAEELMGRLTIEDYDKLSSWNGFTEAVGAMTDMNGQAFPESFDMVGRQVQVTTSLQRIGGLGIDVRGRDVSIRAFDADGRILVELARFIPEPQS